MSRKKVPTLGGVGGGVRIPDQGVSRLNNTPDHGHPSSRAAAAELAADRWGKAIDAVLYPVLADGRWLTVRLLLKGRGAR